MNSTTGGRRCLNDPRCRSCDARVIWVETMSGKKMPLDREPSEGGLFYLFEKPDDGELLAIHRFAAGPRSDGPYYTSHFATCVDAAKHRRR